MGIYLEVDVLHKKKAKIFKKAPNQNIKKYNCKEGIRWL